MYGTENSVIGPNQSMRQLDRYLDLLDDQLEVDEEDVIELDTSIEEQPADLNVMDDDELKTVVNLRLLIPRSTSSLLHILMAVKK